MKGVRSALETPAARLKALIQRLALPDEHVLSQLGWKSDQLASYLHDKRRVRTPQEDEDVERLLTRYQIALAHQRTKNVPPQPLAPVHAASRRATASLKIQRDGNHGSSNLLQSKSQQTSTHESDASGNSNHRKRKRRTVETKKLVDLSSAHFCRSKDLIIPIRIDVQLSNCKYQDTLLFNLDTSLLSPEQVAMRIVSDENLPSDAEDVISESLRRQCTNFICFVEVDSANNPIERLHPISLDLVINGYSLKDQVEWNVNNSFDDVRAFARQMCTDLGLSTMFLSAIIFSMWEQVVGYRKARYLSPWLGNNLLLAKSRGLPSQDGCIDTLPPLHSVLRDDEERWQPVVSELSAEEKKSLPSTNESSAEPQPKETQKSRFPIKRRAKTYRKEHKAPRPINPFILYCQMQKESLSKSKSRRSASENRKIMGDMWRKCTEEEREYYGQLTEVENEKRRREHTLEIRDRIIGEWEVDEARRRGFISPSVLDASAEYSRGLLLENYVSDRHNVDANRDDRE